MTNPNIDLGDVHWLMDILQNIDVGLVVLDKQYNIQLWNGFMDSHSGISPQNAKGENLFNLFPDIPEAWFRQKAEPVFQLKTRTFTIWEQRPYLFHFKNYRPITGRATFMYQNTAIIPLESIDRSINHICVIIYDVTDAALGKEEGHKLTAEINKLTQVNPDTGLMIASAWQEEVGRELARCHRSESPSCLALFDYRNQQANNDQQQVIYAVLSKSLRQTDLATELETGIIAVLLPSSDEGDVRFFAERIRKSINRKVEGFAAATNIGIALSAATFDGPADWINSGKSALASAADVPEKLAVINGNV